MYIKYTFILLLYVYILYIEIPFLPTNPNTRAYPSTVIILYKSQCDTFPTKAPNPQNAGLLSLVLLFFNEGSENSDSTRNL